MKLRHFIFLFMLMGLVGFSWPFSWLFSTPNHENFGSSTWLDKQIQIVHSQIGNIDSKVLKLSLIAYVNAHKKGVVEKPLLTIIDYSKPSTEKRLWVIDLKKNKILFNTWVSHGKNSGGVKATSFSNKPGSLKSSLGVFVTDQPYMGGNGYSLRLKGLEQGINDNAYRRDIVIHGASYVKPGQTGRSWGCPAVSHSMAKSLIDTIKQKSVLFAYYPDRSWLNNSEFLDV